MLPGLAHRLRIEIVRKLKEAQEYVESSGVALSLPRSGSAKPLQPMITSAVTGPTDAINESPKVSVDDSLLGSREEVSAALSRERQVKKVVLKSKAMRLRRERKERFHNAPIACLAPHVAILTDHAPRFNAKGQSTGGNAPSFSVNLSSWIGASLLASLQVSSVDQKNREAWDEEQEAIEASKTKTKKKQDQTDRPGLGAGRGSFLGTVGGLDLGSYGPLSHSARTKFSSGGK
jgi:hypothetical protein